MVMIMKTQQLQMATATLEASSELLELAEQEQWDEVISNLPSHTAEITRIENFVKGVTDWNTENHQAFRETISSIKENHAQIVALAEKRKTTLANEKDTLKRAEKLNEALKAFK